MKPLEWLPLNWQLMSHPFNWVIVYLVIIIFGLIMQLVSKPAE